MSSTRRSHNIGKTLHRLRRENGWTLSTVSTKTGVAVSTLSKIENNQTSPNYDVLVRLCEGLDLNLAEFFQGGTFATFAHGSRTVNRLSDGVRHETPHGQRLVLSTELSRKALEPSLCYLPKETAEPPALIKHSHTGEEFVFIVSGVVKFYMEPYTAIILKAGESVHYDAQMPHGWVAVGDTDAVTLVVGQTGSVAAVEAGTEKMAC